MKRRILCAVLALTLLLAAGCGSGASTSAGSSAGASSGAASGSAGASSSAASGSAGSSSAASSGETAADTVPEFERLNYSLGLLDSGYYEGVAALDHVTLPEKLTGITIPDDVRTVDEAAVVSELETLLDEYSGYEEIRDRAVENGDQVNIDYVGRIGGVEFQGGNTGGQGTTVTAGGSQYIDDFLTQIIGAKPGETVMVEVTFPTPYENNPDLAGKDAVFETVINYIQGEYIIPELTDANVEKYLKEKYGYTTVEEAKAACREMMRYDQMRAHALEWLESQCAFGELPASVLNAQNEMLRIELSNNAYYYNMPLNTLLSYYGWSSMQDVYDYYSEDTLYTVRLYLMCQAVAEKLNLQVSEADVEDYFVNVLRIPEYAVYTVYYGTGYVTQDVLVHKVVMYLIDHAAAA